MVVDMEDSRCRIAAIEFDDPRCKNSLGAAEIAMEDHRCIGLRRPAVTEFDDPRCRSTAMEADDPRCRGMLGMW